MKTRWMLAALFTAASIGFFAGVGFSDDPKSGEDDMMKVMMELAKPGPAHAFMEPFVGDWDATSKMWMGPGEPEVSQGKSTMKWMLGGRFLHVTYEGTMQGMKFEGSGVIGYDNFKKQYENVWIDNLGTALNISKGKAGADGKSLVFTNVWDGPMGKIPGRMNYTILGKDKWKLEGWMTMGGKETKSMEMAFTRRKPAPSSDCR